MVMTTCITDLTSETVQDKDLSKSYAYRSHLYLHYFYLEAIND